MSEQDFDYGEFVENITPDVLGVLKELRFFEYLDDYFCPVDELEKRVSCPGHSFEISAKILRELGRSPEDVDDVIAVLRSQGACCDCEVLYNVAEESRLKARYWKAKYRKLMGEPPTVER